MAYSPHGSRIVYPSLPETLTEDDLARLSTVTSEEGADYGFVQSGALRARK